MSMSGDGSARPRRVFEIRSTFADRAAAESAARRLVEEGVAACGQVEGAVTSVYRWRGKLETATEYRLTVKTSAAAVDRCLQSLRAVHAYEVPELLVTEVSASGDYADWVSESVRP